MKLSTAGSMAKGNRRAVSSGVRVLLWEWVATPIDKGKDVRGKEGCEGSRYYLFSMGSAYWAQDLISLLSAYRQLRLPC